MVGVVVRKHRRRRPSTADSGRYGGGGGDGSSSAEEIAKPHGIYLNRDGNPTNYSPPIFGEDVLVVLFVLGDAKKLNGLGSGWMRRRYAAGWEWLWWNGGGRRKNG